MTEPTPKLHSLPDLLTVRVEDVLEASCAWMERTDSAIPSLVYFAQGVQHVVPLHYESLLELAATVRDPIMGPRIAASVGVRFTIFAMELLERSRLPGKMQEDRASLMDKAACLLREISPESFVISSPVKAFAIVHPAPADAVGGVIFGESCHCHEEGDRLASARLALFVIGCNPVRTFGLIQPVNRDGGEKFREEAVAIDSLCGTALSIGKFSEVYAPARN